MKQSLLSEHGSLGQKLLRESVARGQGSKVICHPGVQQNEWFIQNTGYKLGVPTLGASSI